MFEKLVVIDGKGHLLGRLAATVAKELLNGQRVVIVRAEEIIVSGTLFRNELLWAYFKRKGSNINPWKAGPWHYRSPSKYFWRVLRGMTPHKTARGVAALSRLKVFEGIPQPYSQQKRLVLPNCLRQLRLKDTRKFCTLGQLCGRIGWNQGPVVQKLEEKRQEKASQYWQNKVSL